MSTKKLKMYFLKNQKFSIFEFFRDFFSTNIFRFCFSSKNFSDEKKFWKNFRKHISIQKLPKIPKITLRKSCDEAWYTSSGEEGKRTKTWSGFVPHQVLGTWTSRGGSYMKDPVQIAENKSN